MTAGSVADDIVTHESPRSRESIADAKRPEGIRMTADELNRTAAFWDSIGGLWDRATGGGGVASRPNASVGDWPTAARPPAVSEAVRWFDHQLFEDGAPKFLFLVGGPGAGKSHASASLVSKLTEIGARPSSLAYRTYRYSAGKRDLVLINDATIGSEVHESGALVGDIGDTVAENSHLLACINRGVLVEEISKTGGAGSSQWPGDAVVNWLHAQDPPRSTSSNGWGVETDVSKSYLRAGRLFEGDKLRAQLLVVFVDVCSLLERTPRVRIEQIDSGEFSIDADDYAVEKFPSRRDFAADETPAASLFTEVLATIGHLPEEGRASEFDPVTANLESLASSKVRNGVLSVLRAAEIATSQRLTYREVWGAIARCIVGDATDRVNADQMRAHVQALQPQSSHVIERFREVQLVANLRFSQAIVGADTTGRAEVQAIRNPVTRLTEVVDPVRDAVPGIFDELGDSGWATPIADAFAGHVDSGSPLAQIIDGLGEKDAFNAAVTDFDRQVDFAFAAATQHVELKDAERYSFIAWYGGYLMRLYAISKGIPAFRREISAWTLAWYMSPTLPGDLEEQLHTLLKPPRFPEKGKFSSLIPVFESRTNPVVGEAPAPKIALRAGSVEMKTRTASDSLFLYLEESNRHIPPIVLDFPLMREALACDSGHSGITEVSDVTSPRLERFRAARLVPGGRLDTDSYRVVHGSGDQPLNVGTRA
jgi:hypothetical protein